MYTTSTPSVHLHHGLIILVMAVLPLGACAPVPGEDVIVAPTAAPTLPPATVPPTAVPTEAATATPALGPEEVATSIEQVAGKWKMKILGGGAGDAAVLTLAPEGTFSFDAVGGEHDGMNVGTGTFRFEGETLLLESQHCLNPGPTDIFFACTAQYSVFVAMADGRSASIHFIAIQDEFHDRKLSLDGKTFPPYLEP